MANALITRKGGSSRYYGGVGMTWQNGNGGTSDILDTQNNKSKKLQQLLIMCMNYLIKMYIYRVLTMERHGITFGNGVLVVTMKTTAVMVRFIQAI